jgi:hypothetical protein
MKRITKWALAPILAIALVLGTAGMASAGRSAPGAPFGASNCNVDDLFWTTASASVHYWNTSAPSYLCNVSLKLLCGTYPGPGSWNGYVGGVSTASSGLYNNSCSSGSILNLCVRVSQTSGGPYAYWNENAHAYQYTDC